MKNVLTSKVLFFSFVLTDEDSLSEDRSDRKAPPAPARGRRGGTGTKIPHGVPPPRFLETLCLRRSGLALKAMERAQ